MAGRALSTSTRSAHGDRFANVMSNQDRAFATLRNNAGHISLQQEARLESVSTRFVMHRAIFKRPAFRAHVLSARTIRHRESCKSVAVAPIGALSVTSVVTSCRWPSLKVATLENLV
jgi:hypothetical protein